MPDPLEVRLIKSARDFLMGGRPTLAALQTRQRDEDTAITPESDPAKKPRLIIVVADEGRLKPYAPIHTLRLDLTLRANSKIGAAQRDPFAALCGALEEVLDESNLTVALDSETYGVRVLLAVREAGFTFATEGDLRLQTYGVKVQAVRAELCEGSLAHAPLTWDSEGVVFGG